MLELEPTTRVSCCVLLAALCAGCIGVSQSQQPAESGGSSTPSAAALAQACPNGVRPAVDGLLDDLEDGDSQIAKLDGREGYWWKAKDDQGSTIEPEDFTPVEAGPGGTGLAAMFHGKTVGADGAWGTNFGANLTSGGTYDASKYVGISFRAKVGPSSLKKVRFKVGDVSTHPDAGVCKDCWNHFGKDFVLGTEWQEYQVLFSELRQAAGWGDPRPPSITPAQLVNLDWSVGPSGDFEVYVDDIQFLECQ